VANKGEFLLTVDFLPATIKESDQIATHLLSATLPSIDPQKHHSLTC
jgi:hypothetical protein